MGEKKQNFIEDNITILSKQTIDLLLKEKNPSDLIALYVFYYYTAKWQGTNKAKATVGYAAKGLKWGRDKTRKAKIKLTDLGLISDERTVSKKTGKVSGWYVKINYLWKMDSVHPTENNECGKQVISDSDHPTENQDGGNHPTDSPEGGLNHRVDFKATNALSVNNINALSASSKSCNASVAGSEVNKFIELFEPVNPTFEKLFANKTQRAAAERLLKKFGFEKMAGTLEVVKISNCQKYSTKITTPLELENNLGKLVAFFQANPKLFKIKQLRKA